MSQEVRLALTTTLGMLVIFAAFIAVVWKAGLFTFSGTDPSAKVVAAAIVLVGGLVGSLISGLGIILKHSLDVRNSNLRDEAERRLRVETAIQAVKLLRTDIGVKESHAQRATVLFALSSLDMIELAVRMLRQCSTIKASAPQPPLRLLTMALNHRMQMFRFLQLT